MQIHRWLIWEYACRNAVLFPFFFTNILLNGIVWAAVGPGCITIFVRPKRVSGREMCLFKSYQTDVRTNSNRPSVINLYFRIPDLSLFQMIGRPLSFPTRKEEIQNCEGRRSLIGIWNVLYVGILCFIKVFVFSQHCSLAFDGIVLWLIYTKWCFIWIIENKNSRPNWRAADIKRPFRI